MSSKDPANDIKNPPSQAPATDKGKKKVRIRKGEKWTEVDVDSIIRKGRFKYVKFTDDDGLETYWISQE